MGFRASLVGIDQAGGLLVSTPQDFVRFGGLPVGCVGSQVASHGSGSHNAASVIVGSTFFRIAGFPVAFETCAASCAHLCTGSSHVTISE